MISTFPLTLLDGEKNTNSVLNNTQTGAQDLAKQQGVSATQVSKPPTPTNPFAPTPTYVDQAKSTVAGQLEGLFKSDSPYIRQAEDKAKAYAADRGYGNSLLAAQVGRTAAYEAALPIATSDAATYAQQSLENQRAGNLFGLTGYQGKLQEDITRQQADYNSRIAKEQAGYNSELSKQQAGQTEQLTTLQSNLLMKNQDIQNQFTEKLKGMEIESAYADSLSNIVGTQTNNLMNGIFAMIRDPNVEMSKETLDWATDFMYSSWESAADIYGLDIEVV